MTAFPHERLRPYRDRDIEAAFAPAFAARGAGMLIAGVFDGMLFSVTVDEDGHTEAVLSTKADTRPGDGRVRAFFRHLGVAPFRELAPDELTLPYTRAFIVVPGRPRA